jgi:hypothetical protein
MPELTIDFSHNWNSKLCCQYFTTIRPRNDHKYILGGTYRLTYKKAKELGPGVIMLISHFTLAQISDAIFLLDMGYPPDECRKLLLTMYKNYNFDWDKQQFSFILLHQPHKTLYHEPISGEYKEVEG